MESVRPVTLTPIEPSNTTNANRTELAEIVAGFAIGFFLEDNVNKTCLAGFDVVEKEFEDVVSLLTLRSASEALKALRLLSTAFHGMDGAVKRCGATTCQVEQLFQALETFKSPLHFFYKAGKNLVINGKEIYSELEAARVNWESKQYKAFGFEIGIAMRKVVVGSSDTRANPLPFTGPIELRPQDAVEFVIGLAQGFFTGEVHVEPTCIADAEQLWFEVQKSLAYFAQGTRKDTLRGLRELAKVMELGYDALHECKAEKKHLRALMKAIMMIKNPINFAFVVGKHLIVDHIEILHELNAATDDWKTSQFRSFGSQLGLICSQVLVGGISPTPPIPVPETPKYPDEERIDERKKIREFDVLIA